VKYFLPCRGTKSKSSSTEIFAYRPSTQPTGRTGSCVTSPSPTPGPPLAISFGTFAHRTSTAPSTAISTLAPLTLPTTATSARETWPAKSILPPPVRRSLYPKLALCRRKARERGTARHRRTLDSPHPPATGRRHRAIKSLLLKSLRELTASRKFQCKAFRTALSSLSRLRRQLILNELIAPDLRRVN